MARFARRRALGGRAARIPGTPTRQQQSKRERRSRAYKSGQNQTCAALFAGSLNILVRPRFHKSILSPTWELWP